MARTMALVGLPGPSQALLDDDRCWLGGSTRLTLGVGNSNNIMTQTRLVIRTQYRHDEGEMSRRVVVRLVTTGLALGSFTGVVFAEEKLIKQEERLDLKFKFSKFLGGSRPSFSLFFR
ncbi:hypothetical protein L6452_35365 [Arctium lappa]|uniref:Uncharacterized protein n=1 Tax=Arctium lappa TaxID=4217 RepID=A0ACB8Y5I4_ARCLA|nr:hypothetical protein L6452_35365 [Arctium lappa]